MSTMYSEINKEQIPSAPPSYSETVIEQKYAIDTQLAGSNIIQYPQGSTPAGTPHILVVQVPTVPPLGRKSVQLSCPTCKDLVMTNVEKELTPSAFLCCLLMVFGCYLCSCIPFCMKNFKNYIHKCPKCNAFIGSYKS